MDLIALAVPFFLLALIIEMIINWQKGTGLYRSNDAINSLSAGVLSTTFGYFTKFVSIVIWGFALQNFALFDMQLDWFDASPGGIALWIAAALGWDFCYYWNHRLGHEVSVLWAAHAVHHQSEDYNLSTALRQTSSSFLFSWIFYLPLFLLGFPLEILITVNAANLIYQFWVHTQLVGKLGVLDRVLVTPSNHRVHHAQNQAYIDKNYGGIFVLWDRLFGTFQEELDDDPVIFGVRKPLASWNPFWANLQVYDYLLFDARNTGRWRDKLGIWFRRTGWRPEDVAKEYPKLPADLARFEKYDPAVAPGRRRYVLSQFMVVVVLALFIAQVFAERGVSAVLAPCVLLWAQLYTLSLLNDSKRYANRFEALRLLLIVPVGAFAMQNQGVVPELGTAAWAGVLIYVLVSMLWLRKV
ncbi:MAG: sterol desaturase family protein [Gammaproteobacteria bacterium]|nr:sterol desaturase family protein [Gammaproteobacteria bacterium]